jgi:hypothetical protein
MTENLEKVEQNRLPDDKDADSEILSVEEKLQIFANLIVDRLLEVQGDVEGSDFKAR